MCELLTQELIKYYQHSALTSQFITRAIGHLASNCPENIEIFGEAGAVEGVVVTLNRQVQHCDFYTLTLASLGMTTHHLLLGW